MRATTGWQSHDHSTVLTRVPIERRDLRGDDIAVRIDYCGVCHSDLHRVRGTLFDEGDLVPGHEFTGTVTEVGADVSAFAVGDPVAVGTIVDSCGVCAMCEVGQENFCYNGATSTYGLNRADGSKTAGGYSREYVLREKFAYRLPAGLDPAAAAPLMCAGITVWEPMRALGVRSGSRIAVAGLGGLGHLAVKFGVALGATVTVLSRTPEKADDARKLGAVDLLHSDDDFAGARGRFDLILDTISAPHEIPPLLHMAALDGTVSVLGYPGQIPLRVMDLIYGRKKLSSSGTGGRRGTAEMLAFAGEHGITADVEVLPSGRISDAFDRLDRGDVRYRFVLDLSDLD
ncbi:NAD(P)-dependent alcohol dehydrogenase [Actinoplanes sp. NPDC051343]|uniref:NAD(P)-dependent alcohol dehydrogenase n=1 Tax=Actinoplanes sp. NPDC051343 TaxID=3363906 RepID=UPI003788D64C